MPGKRITDHQVLKYKSQRRSLTQTAAAAKVAISERSARRIERIETLPSQTLPRQWRTRTDPFAAVWEAEVLPLLEANPHLNAVTLLEELQRRHPVEYEAGLLRTLQRRLRLWRVSHGGEREVFFAQEHPPGRQGLSDFTVADDLAVTLAGVAFPHRLYQFALAHSGWRHAGVVDGGESFNALATGLQDALGVPAARRKNIAPTASRRHFGIFQSQNNAS